MSPFVKALSDRGSDNTYKTIQHLPYSSHIDSIDSQSHLHPLAIIPANDSAPNGQGTEESDIRAPNNGLARSPIRHVAISGLVGHRARSVPQWKHGQLACHGLFQSKHIRSAIVRWTVSVARGIPRALRPNSVHRRPNGAADSRQYTDRDRRETAAYWRRDESDTEGTCCADVIGRIFVYLYHS